MARTKMEELAQTAVDTVRAEGGLAEKKPDEFAKTVGERGRAAAIAAGLPEDEAKRVQMRAGMLALEVWETTYPDEVRRRQIPGVPRAPESYEKAQVDDPQQPESAVGETHRPPGGVRRVNVNFSEQAYAALEDLARRTGKSMSDVLRDAIALKTWFEQTRAEGGHVLVERPDGKIREVISV